MDLLRVFVLLCACASMFACAAAKPTSDLCRGLASGDVRVAYTRVTTGVSTRSFWRDDEGDVLASTGSPSGWLRSENLRALRPETVIHEYSWSNGRPRLVRGWSERNGETVCRLYERKDGKRDLLLCRVESSPRPWMLSFLAREALPGAVSIDSRAESLRIGVRCSVHGDLVLALLLPQELEGCAAQVLARVVDAAVRGSGSLGWCVTGVHEVVAPLEGP